MNPRLASTSLIVACAATSLWAADPDDAAFREAFLGGSVDWAAVEDRAADEGEVNLHYWGGSDLLNIWMDRVVAPAMQDQGVRLNPIRITATKDAIDLVLAERTAGRGLGQGSVDMIWVNGENFATLRRQDALFGGFAQSLPNSVNLSWDENDPRALLNLRDFGVPTDLAEVPWSGEQYVCAYNAARVAPEDVPSTFAEMEAYLRANPGKFTYVKPPHYLGNTFVQQAIYAHNPDGTGATPFQQSIDQIAPEELARLIAPGIEYLQEIAPLLLGAGSGTPRYPADNSALDGLFLNGEIDFNCQFGLYSVATGLSTGTYPEQARQFVFPEGNMIKNKNYLVIPGNAPNSAAALVLANWMTSVDAQASKLELVGMPAGIDSFMLSAEDAQRIADASPGLVGVTQAELDANTAPDTNATLVDVIEATWLEVLERGNTAPIAEIVANAYANLQ